MVKTAVALKLKEAKEKGEFVLKKKTDENKEIKESKNEEKVEKLVEKQPENLRIRLKKKLKKIEHKFRVQQLKKVNLLECHQKRT